VCTACAMTLLNIAAQFGAADAQALGGIYRELLMLRVMFAPALQTDTRNSRPDGHGSAVHPPFCRRVIPNLLSAPHPAPP